MKNLIVSGSNGLVGRTLLPLLRSDFNVIEVERKNLNVNYLREVSNKISNRYSFLHLAWPVSEKNYLQSRDNKQFLKESLVLMNFLIQDKNCDLIIGVGSILEHGVLEEVFDNSPLNPMSLYAEAKSELSEFLNLYANEKSRWIRIGYQVSALDPPTKMVPTLLANTTGQNPLMDPYKSLDLIHRYDVASAIHLYILNQNKVSEFNTLITTGRSLALYSLANEFLVHKIEKPREMTFTQKTHPRNLHSLNWAPKCLEARDLAKTIKSEIR